MKAYELVLVVDPQTTQEERDAVHEGIQKIAGKSAIKHYEDMWLMQFEYEMYQKKWLHQGFVSSYHVEVESETMAELKQELSYNKKLLRYVFFGLSEQQPYYTMSEVEEKIAPLVESDEWTINKSLTLFDNKENESLLIWKAVPLLKKFMTRFGDIKPRKYTGISVSQQKRVRKAILRARELWVVPYIK